MNFAEYQKLSIEHLFSYVNVEEICMSKHKALSMLKEVEFTKSDFNIFVGDFIEVLFSTPISDRHLRLWEGLFKESLTKKINTSEEDNICITCDELKFLFEYTLRKMFWVKDLKCHPKHPLYNYIFYVLDEEVDEAFIVAKLDPFLESVEDVKRSIEIVKLPIINGLKINNFYCFSYPFEIIKLEVVEELENIVKELK